MCMWMDSWSLWNTTRLCLRERTTRRKVRALESRVETQREGGLTMIDPALNAQLIHTIKIVAECVTAAAFLSFLWLVIPACRKGGPRR